MSKIPYLQGRSRPCKLEVSWLQLLKDLIWVILCADINQTLLICLSIPSKNILIRRGVVLIDILEIQVHGLCGGDSIVDDSVGGRGNTFVVC